MTNPNVENFNPGGVPDRVDLRDHQWSEVGFGTAPFDWNAGYDVEAEVTGKLPVKDQNGSSSCGGQAWANYAGALECVATETLEERSAKYIYAQTHLSGGGSSGRDNATIFVKQGVSRETECPSYDAGLPPSEDFMIRGQDITDAARIDAKSDTSKSYANVAVDIDIIAQAVKANHGAIILIEGSNNGTWLSKFPLPPKDGETIWRHWVYVGKALTINGVKYLGFLNSWGESTGENGWQYIAADYVATHVLQCWTHVFGTNPQPTFKHNFAVDIVYGQSGSEVQALQDALKLDGSFPTSVPSSGFYGDVTRRAVLAFQLKYQIDTAASLLALNGKRVGHLTRGKLNEIFNK